MLASIPFLLLAIFGQGERMIYLGVFMAIALMFTNAGPCYAIIGNVVMPNMRAVACAVAMAATHLLGDIWSPTLMAWVAQTFGQADSMATPFGQALAAIGAVPKAQPGHDPENLAAALLIAVPGPAHRGHRAALRRPPSASRDGAHARQAEGGAKPRACRLAEADSTRPFGGARVLR